MKIVPHTFQNRLNGLLGDWWQREQLKEIERVRQDIESGRITFKDGVAYNCIGNVLMDDLAEVVEYIAPEGFSRESTRVAREEECHKWAEEYRSRPQRISDEDIYEMRAAFGSGETVIDIISGQKIQL